MHAMRSPCVMAPSCARRLAAVDAKRISPCVHGAKVGGIRGD